MGIYTRSLTVSILFFLVFSLGAEAQKKKKNKKKNKSVPAQVMVNELDSISYGLGMGMAKNLQKVGIDSINVDAYTKGLLTVFKGDSTLLSEASIQDLLDNYVKVKSAEKIAKEIEKNENYLLKNKMRPEVDTLPSGLQYEVLEEGFGPKPKPESEVTVNYVGKLIDGTIFDSSIERGEPATFKLNQVIPGWTKGLQLMSPGAKYILYIPAELGYGVKGAGNSIPPNATLIFEIELLNVNY